MTITRVQGHAVTSAAATSLAGTLTTGVTSGNLLVATVSCGSNTTTFTGPTGWTQATINQPSGVSDTQETSIWWGIVGSGGLSAGSTSWTWTLSASHNPYICIEEWNSTTGWVASPVDKTANGETGTPATATTVVSGTTATTTQASELWVASLMYNGAAQSESSITSGWTKDLEVTDGSNNHTVTMLYNVASSTGASACQYTIGTAEFWCGCVATFLPVVVTTSSRTVPATAALQSTNSRIVPATAALQGTVARTVPATAALQSTNSRTIPATAAIANTFSRTIPAKAALTNTGSRTIPATAALMATNSRTISATAALLSTNSRIIPASAALAQSAVFYASNVAQTLGGLTQSDQMSQVAGGTETSFTVTAPSSGTNTYLELVSQGGTPGTTLALPAPTGKGWSIPLQGNTILSGSWSFAFTLAKSGASMTGGALYVRAYRRTMDGTYYYIGSAFLTGQTFSTKAVYTTPSINAALWQFIAGDTLYMDAFVLNTTTAWSSDVFTVYVSNSATQGVYSDGIIIAPQMMSTPAELACYISNTSMQTGTTLPIRDQSITIADAIDQRSIATLTGEDVNGSLSYQRAMPVVLGDHDQGLLYTGYVNSDKVSKPSAGGVAQLEHTLTFMDNHYLVDKRANLTNYLNWTAGDMVCDFVESTLSQEGITGEFAIDADYSQAAFAQGTLTNTTATTTTSPFTYAPNTAQPPTTSNTGDLELTRAGTQFTLTETVTSDFSSGTLTNMVASNNQLSPTTQSAIKVTTQYSPVATVSNVPATESGGIQTDEEQLVNYARVQIWSGSMTVGTSDTFNYDVWIASTSPAFMAGMDIKFSDGTYLINYIGTLDLTTDLGLFDQNGVSVDRLQDLSAYAKDVWYTRNITLTGLNGKTINNVYVYLAGSSGGTYTVFTKNCYLGSQSGSPFFGTAATTTQLNPPTITAIGGYLPTTINTSIVSVYNPLVSYRVSGAHSISGIGLVQNSSITWTASLPSSGTSPTAYPPGALGATSSSSSGTSAMVMLVSYDGNAWLECQNSQALPGLPPGANVSGLSLYLREQFAAGSDPSAIPALLDVSITINSAANQTVSDVIATYGTSTQWNTGTQVLTNPNANGNLTLGGSANPLTQSWASSTILNNQTFLAGAGNSGTQAVSGGAYTMTPGAQPSGGSWCQSRFDFAGYFQNGTIEADVKYGTGGTQCGIEYRQTGWGNANNNGAYYVAIESGALIFGFGQNNFSNTGGTFTQVVSSSQTITSNTYYHLKIVVSGNRHTIYFNHSGTAAIDIIDNTYPSAGQIGFRAFTGGTSAFTASIDNFSLVTTTAGTWTSPSTSLSSLGTCGYSQICWTDLDSRGQVENTTTVLASIDGGTTWQQCVNGAEIPQLPRGTSVSGVSIQFQMILYSSTPPISTPVIMGLYMRCCGNYGTVTGTRISPVLNLSPVGYVASSNVFWNANVPTNTTLAVATTQDLSTYHTVGSNGAGEALPYWANQPSATQDLFNTNTSSNYTSTSKVGGSAASVAYNTANSSLTLAGGSGGMYLNNSISTSDVDELVDMDESDSGGLVWRKVDASNFYYVSVADASASIGTPNTLTLYRVGYSSVVLSDTPLAYYRLGEASGTSATDSSGHGYTGTYAGSGVTYAQTGAMTGDTNTAVLFNGSTGKMTMPTSVNPETGSFTFECWVKVASYPGSGTSLLANYNTPSSNIGAGFGMNTSGQINWTVCNGSGAFVSITSSPISTGAYHHIVGVYDGTASKFYLDGSLVGSITTTFTPNLTDAIQVASSPYNDYAACSVDEVAIYSTALSSSRVTAHYSAATTPPNTQLATASITFTRGTFHRPRVVMAGGLINVYWDGQCKISYLDISPLASGACGLRNDGGTSRYYQLWVQALGSNLSGQALWSKVTMTTSDPSVMPQLFTLVMCVRGPSIATGATIAQLHPVTKPFAAYYSTEIDTAVQASGDFFWYVDKWKALHFGPRLARPGAFPIQSVADSAGVYSGYLLYQPQVSVLSSADLFRNEMIINNVDGLVTPPPEVRAADGSTTSWTMGYPLYSAPTITINGQGATVGLQGVDSGHQFYWQPGSASISYDSSLPKLPAGTILVFSYVGQSTVNVVLNNTSSQTVQAALEGNSGIVAAIQSALSQNVLGMTVDQATTFGNGLLSRYGSNNTIEMVGVTRYGGLTPGTVIPVFLQEIMGTWNAQLPIVKMTTTAYQGANGLIYLFSIDATNGPNLSQWSRVWFGGGQ